MQSSVAIDESLVREVVSEVLSQLGRKSGCPGNCSEHKCAGPVLLRRGRGLGIFEDPAEACEAAAQAFLKLQEQGVAARAKVVEIVKTLAVKNQVEWAKLELAETKIGRLDHKIEKLDIIKQVPGVEFIYPWARSGDHGITHEEYTPFGVIAAVTPSTHSIPTVSGNIINMVAAGNAVVFNAHPNAAQCAVKAVETYNEAIRAELGIENLVCMVDPPTLESFQGMCKNDHVRLICVTGGEGVVKAAMGIGKRAICAGPGNPPVVVAEDADPDSAAKKIIQGAAYDNNLLCVGEKEVFAVESKADALMAALERNGAYRLSSSQLERLTAAAFTIEKDRAGGCARAIVNRDLLGRDAEVLAKAAGAQVPAGTQLLFAETGPDHPFVKEEQMMPFLPVTRSRDVHEAIRAAKVAEHNYRHTSIIHTQNVGYMTEMARALDTTLFIKNGPCMAGLGIGGEGYLSYTIATPTGEGVSNPKTFTRVRRCVMVDNLRIY